MTIDAARMRTESEKGLGSDPERMLAFRPIGGVDVIDLSTGDGRCSPRVAECEVLENFFEYVTCSRSESEYLPRTDVRGHSDAPQHSLYSGDRSRPATTPVAGVGRDVRNRHVGGATAPNSE
jgi:hypothetical protein